MPGRDREILSPDTGNTDLKRNLGVNSNMLLTAFSWKPEISSPITP